MLFISLLLLSSTKFFRLRCEGVLAHISVLKNKQQQQQQQKETSR